MIRKLFAAKSWILLLVGLVVVFAAPHYLGYCSSPENYGHTATVAEFAVTACALVLVYETYQKESRRHSSTVLIDLVSRFYENPEWRDIRAMLEQENSPGESVSDLERAVAEHLVERKSGSSAMDNDARNASYKADGRQHRNIKWERTREKVLNTLDEYLNFFEFLGWLSANKDLRQADIEGMFKYYLTILSRKTQKGQVLHDYVEAYGFTNLRKLLEQTNEEAH